MDMKTELLKVFDTWLPEKSATDAAEKVVIKQLAADLLNLNSIDDVMVMINTLDSTENAASILEALGVQLAAKYVQRFNYNHSDGFFALLELCRAFYDEEAVTAVLQSPEVRAFYENGTTLY